MQFNYMICPVHDLGVSAFTSVQCVPNPVFVWREWKIWSPVANTLSSTVSTPLGVYSSNNFCSWDDLSRQSHMLRINFICLPCHALRRWSRPLEDFLLQVSNVRSTLKTLVKVYPDMVE